MAYTEFWLSRANKDGLISIAPDMQSSKLETNSILTDIKKEYSEINFLNIL